MKKVYYYIILLVYSSYWLMTFFFNAPDNYIKIQFFQEGDAFNKFFYQKWGFFAPPPQFDEKLYCLILSKKDTSEVKSFELMQAIIKEKVDKAPFNNKADVLDYILSNSCISINNQIVELKDRVEYLEKKRKLEAFEKDSILNRGLEVTSYYKVLKNYVQEVARKKNVNSKDYLVSFMITNTPIPKFVNRNKDSVNVEESLVYRSKPFDI
ncbi:hypothetical protein SAMN04489761_4550 [Tenacibaculum sp. MAR_2009_124]|uniref:hypothetical protein n=1 Tax=Tenacibaculum sp. MAR_2009_124 TaxID=1250059 RepID=UPI00089C1CC4|nr:hypothetical protein [Tenacibaculum sp. MAR_2009_124]SED18592.1 hypothetical protein SAMN04489761_4550 [Tenacibaculum sp. MAR_2009_124]